MKTLKLLGIFIFTVILTTSFISCSSDDEPDVEPKIYPYIWLNKLNYDIDGNAQAITVSIRTNMKNVNVALQKGSKWIVLEDVQATETGNEYIFSVEANNGNELRVEFIVFSAENVREAATIIQTPLTP